MNDSPPGGPGYHISAILGCIGTVIAAIISGVFLIISQKKMASTSSANDGSAAYQKLEEEAKRREAAEIEAFDAKMQRRMYERQALIERIAVQYRNPSHEKFDRISIRNDCIKTISAAVRYLALDNQWVVVGWWEIVPGQTVLTDAITRNDYVWLYGEAKDISWNGAGEDGAVRIEVIERPFITVGGEMLSGPGKRTVTFYRRTTGETWDTDVYPMKCD